jgi:hypothetical protein
MSNVKIKDLTPIAVNVCRLLRFANVLFCALAVHYFFFLSLSSKLSVVSVFLHLAVTFGGMKSLGGDCGLLSCPITPNLMRGRMLE